MAAFIAIANVIPEHQTILAESSKILATLTDVSSYAIKGASSVNYPNLAARAGQNVGISSSFTNSDANYSDEVLSLNQKIGDAFSVNIAQEKQNMLRNLEDSTKESLRAMGMQMDKACYDALIAALASAGENVVPTSDMYADVVNLSKVLDNNKVPAEDRFLLVSPNDYAKLLGVSKFTSWVDRGDGSALKTGVVGQILGFTVIKSTAVTGDSIAYHKKALAWAIQGDTQMMETPDSLATKVQYSIFDLFGCKATQSGAFAVRLGANPA